MPSFYFFWALLLLSCSYAVLRGRHSERLVAFICLGATLASHYLRSPLNERYVGLELGDVLVDFGVLLAFVAVALRSDRFWPLWIAGIQLTMSVTHVLKAIQPDLIPIAYAAAVRFWSYPILIILAVATYRARRRLLGEMAVEREPSPA